MSRKMMQKAKGSFLPLLSLMLLGLAFTWGRYHYCPVNDSRTGGN